MTGPSKILGLADAVAMVSDGQLVAFGGDAGGRRPMAALFEIVRQGRRGLRVAGWNCGIDVDLLAGAGCLAAIETSRRDFERIAPADNCRRGVASGEIRLIEHPEDTVLERFQAAALGLPMLPSTADPAAVCAAANPHLKSLDDPFTGRSWTVVEAIRPDVAIIHADAADAAGNVRMHPAGCDVALDVMIARSAKIVIVTVEQIVCGEALARSPAILPSAEVSCVVEVPYGAHPSACLPLYGEDVAHRERYAAAASGESFRSWLAEFVTGPSDHWSYLQTIGSERLMRISRNRAARG